MSEKFVTSINCMDGRVQIPAIKWLQENYQADYVDMLTYPGPDKLLSSEKSDKYIELIQKEVEISIKKHGSQLIAVEGHFDCAGNPVDEETHLANIKKSVETVKSWGVEAEVIGLYINQDWQVEKVI